jgi:hypothetical protein
MPNGIPNHLLPLNFNSGSKITGYRDTSVTHFCPAIQYGRRLRMLVDDAVGKIKSGQYL